MDADVVAFFQSDPRALAVASAVLGTVAHLGPHEVHVTRSQVALRGPDGSEAQHLAER